MLPVVTLMWLPPLVVRLLGGEKERSPDEERVGEDAGDPIVKARILRGTFMKLPERDRVPLDESAMAAEGEGEEESGGGEGEWDGGGGGEEDERDKTPKEVLMREKQVDICVMSSAAPGERTSVHLPRAARAV